MKANITIKGTQLNFCNFFLSKDASVEGLVESLECDTAEAYTTYSLNSLKGQQNRMTYSANNGLVNIQLGNTSTYIFTDLEGTIYGVDHSTSQIIKESNLISIEKAIMKFKEDVKYDSEEYNAESWYNSWKKGIDDTISFCKKYYNKLTYHGYICNEMWRIMAAEPETIEKYNLIFDHYHDEFVEVPIKPGIWEITSSYDGDNPIYFIIKQKEYND
jgi:hypothetical protein